MKWSKPRRGLYYATGSPGSNSEVHLRYIIVIIILKDRILHFHILDYFSATYLEHEWAKKLQMVNSLLSNYAKFCTSLSQCNGSKQFASQIPSSLKKRMFNLFYDLYDHGLVHDLQGSSKRHPLRCVMASQSQVVIRPTHRTTTTSRLSSPVCLVIGL